MQMLPDRPLNPLVIRTDAPPIPEARAWIDAYGGEHGPAIDLCQAVPSVPPPQSLLDRLGASARSPASAAYGPILGDGVLRAAFAGNLSAAYGGQIVRDEVAITAGCNQAFFVAMLALVKPGDAVLLPAPWYFNHKMTLDMLGLEARPLPALAEDGFIPDPDAAARLIDGRTAAIVLVSPNNPTGAVYPPEVIRAFFELCRARRLYLVLDETYREFLPEETGAPHDLFSDPDWPQTLVHLFSFSKSYAISGHRLGALVGSRGLLDQVGKVLDSLQICAPRVAQAPVAWAIEALADWRLANARSMIERGSTFRRALASQNLWQAITIGAYFAYVQHPFEHAVSREAAARLAGARGILTLPGSFFGPGQERFLRVSFANVGPDVLATLGKRFLASLED
jgi:aspartate/methionine/tyrosine aminotransferase